jgi:hypothetical protein
VLRRIRIAIADHLVLNLLPPAGYPCRRTESAPQKPRGHRPGPGDSERERIAAAHRAVQIAQRELAEDIRGKLALGESQSKRSPRRRPGCGRSFGGVGVSHERQNLYAGAGAARGAYAAQSVHQESHVISYLPAARLWLALLLTTRLVKLPTLASRRIQE